jgi:hypothetical protein
MSDEHVGNQADDADEFDILDDLLGVDDAEADDRSEEIQEETEPEPQPQPQPRTRRRILALRERLQRQEAENRQLRDRLLQAPVQQPVQQGDPYRQAEMERQEAERVAQLMPHEQALYYSRQAEQRMQYQLLRQNLESRDMFDRQLFNSLCQQEPMAARLADEVESTLAQARALNMNPTREAIYNLLVGSEVRNRAKKQVESQRKKGRAQIAAQTTQPGGTRSTAAASRTRAAQDRDAGLDDRLRKATVGDSW